MSNPPSSLQDQQKMHRRQQSIPVHFEAMKVPHMLPAIQPRQDVHKRGQSFDVSRSPIHRQHITTGSMSSTRTNTGSTHGQQILREAQQQRIARPGRSQPQYTMSIPPQHNIPYQTIHGQTRQMPMDAMMHVPSTIMPHPQFQNMQVPMPVPVPQGTFNFAPSNQQYFPTRPSMSQRMVMVNSMNRRIPQPDLKIETDLKPFDSVQADEMNFHSLTPITTPSGLQSSYPPQQMLSSAQWQKQDAKIVSPRPLSVQQSRSLQGIAEHEENCFEQAPGAPTEATRSHLRAVLEPMKRRSPLHVRTGSMDSEAAESRSLFADVSDEIPKLEGDSRPYLKTEPSSPVRPALSPRRIEIADLNLEPGINASIEETNISLDEIAQYIEGPDPVDNKYVCRFEDCDKRFGRKENIKSHIQTHLGDRQFRCDHCMKRFVRGHDLKRHAKIHTGRKSYQCACGNAFARHDALTRHRQRGMCVGAFDGVIRKEVKRGRPRKHRPEMDDRLQKSSRTRQSKDQSLLSPSKIDMYNSSASSCSISSWGSPPTEPMNHLSIHGAHQSSPVHVSPYDESISLFGLSEADMTMHGVNRMELHQASNVQHVFNLTPPASPGYSCGNKPSPNYRELTPSELASLDNDMAQDNMNLRATTTMSRFNTASSPLLDPSSQGALPPHVSPAQIHRRLRPISQDSFSFPSSLPALSHSSSPPPPPSKSANQSTTNATNSLVFDFDSDTSPLRMSTMSGMSGFDFGMSLSKVPLPGFDDDAAITTQQHSSMHTKNEFDSFLDMDDSQMSLGMNSGNLNLGMNMHDDAFF